MVHKQQKAIVIGGAGFIGSHLVDELVRKGYSVHVLDDLSNGKREFVNEKATFQKGDIRKVEDVKLAFEKVGKGAFVFHLACLPRVQFTIDYPKESNDVNISGLVNVFIAAKDSKATRVIYSASSSAYGDQDTLPLVETMKPNPMSPYAVQKYAGELYATVFSMVYGLEIVSLRYFNVYGSRQDPFGGYAQAIPKFIAQKKDGKAITITGDGEQRRDNTHVSDVVAANILAMKSKNVGKGEVINIGSGINYSVNEIAKLVGGKIEYIPARIEPKKTLADISKAKKLLGWTPQVSLKKGIEELKKQSGIK